MVTVAENHRFSSSDSNNTKVKKIGFGALLMVLFGIVAVALIFLSKAIGDTDSDKSYQTKTTTAQTVVSTATTTEPIIYDDFPWDLNVVTFEQLISIDDIGEDIAGKILDFKAKNGEFVSISQLLEIDGIGEKRFKNLCKYLYVDGEIVTTQNTVTATETTTEKISITTSQKTTTTKITTTKKPATSPKPVTTITVLERRFVNINTATLDEIMNGFLLTYEEAESIINLRNAISYFQNPLEVLYATDSKGKTMFSDDEYNEFKDYILVE